MGVVSRASLIAGRAVSVAVIARVAKRYPIVALVAFIVRRRRTKASRDDRSVVRLRRGETLTVTDRVR
jgi:hypothetical protein